MATSLLEASRLFQIEAAIWNPQTFSFEIMYLTAINQNRKFLRRVFHNIQHNYYNRYNKMATVNKTR